MHLETFNDLVEGKAAFQVGPADEVLAVAHEVAMPVHKARIDGAAFRIDDFLGDILTHNGFFIADGDKLAPFQGEGLGYGEIVVNGIDLGVVDDKFHRRFVVAGGHNE